MISDLHPVAAGLIRGAAQRFVGDPLDWLEGNVVLPHSARATLFDRQVAPWLNEIIQTFAAGPHKIGRAHV